MPDIKGFSRGYILPLMLLMVIGMSMGCLGFILFGDFAGNTEVVYVSKKEILKLEKERIEQLRNMEHLKDADEKAASKADSIFYGHTNEALTLIEQTAKSFKDKTTKVIFVSDEFIQGEGVSSIGKAVHERVINQLKTIKTGKYEDN